jgi:hypothetical protein
LLRSKRTHRLKPVVFVCNKKERGCPLFSIGFL